MRMKSTSFGSKIKLNALCFAAACGLLALLTAIDASADSSEDGQVTRPEAREEESAASFDKRLPPVIPGEEIRDGNKKIKVWSSAGPVPVNTGAATAPVAPGASNVIPAEVGVIVDRDREHRRR